MGAITAVKKSYAGTPQEMRFQGMKDLGAALIGNTSAATTAQEYAAGLRQALHEIVSDTLNYEVSYAYISADTGAEAAHKLLSVEAVSGVNVFCNLSGSKRKLHVTVRVDSRNSNVFNMQAVFPEPVDRENYDYLFDTAKDLVGASPADAQKYLAVFKFLGRCH